MSQAMLKESERMLSTGPTDGSSMMKSKHSSLPVHPTVPQVNDKPVQTSNMQGKVRCGMIVHAQSAFTTQTRND